MGEREESTTAEGDVNIKSHAWLADAEAVLTRPLPGEGPAVQHRYEMRPPMHSARGAGMALCGVLPNSPRLRLVYADLHRERSALL